MKRVRVVGLGSLHGGDDGVGVWAAETMRRILPPEVDVRIDATGGAGFHSWCEEVDVLVLIDAAEARPGFSPGTVLRVDYRAEPGAFQALAIPGTHGIGLPNTLALAKQIGVLPREVIVYAVAAERFEQGEPLSDAVCRSLMNLVRSVRSDILGVSCGDGSASYRKPDES